MKTRRRFAALALLGLVVSGLVLSALSGTPAGAQERSLQNPSSGASAFAPRAGATVGAAPVWNGHEQPTESSIPPAIRREESRDARQPADPLGPLPQICKDC